MKYSNSQDLKNSDMNISSVCPSIDIAKLDFQALSEGYETEIHITEVQKNNNSQFR